VVGKGVTRSISLLLLLWLLSRREGSGREELIDASVPTEEVGEWIREGRALLLLPVVVVDARVYWGRRGSLESVVQVFGGKSVR